MICQCCNKTEANSKRRPICKTCYTLLHKEGMLNQFPLLEDDKFKDKLINKYGADIINDLRGIMKQNLREIGEKYGFTREYTRLIFNKLFGYKYTIIKNQRNYKLKEAQEAISVLKKDPRHKVNSYTCGSLQHSGALAEKTVLEICESLNYEVKPYCDQSIDLVINGYLVDVKASYKTCFTGHGQKTPLCHFQRSESQRKADFIICCMVQEKQFFIIPKNALKGLHLYIPTKGTSEWVIRGTTHHRTNHWYKYLDAWHLLNKQEEPVFVKRLAIIEQPNSRDLVEREAAVM